MSHLAQDILFGVVVGDAIGIPVEFDNSQDIDIKSVQSNYLDIPNRLTGFGTWYKPIGTFSDDSSLTLCTAEYFANGEDNLNSLMNRFKDWMKEGYWTADGDVFDIGRTTYSAIQNYSINKDWKTAGLNTEQDNGNGSLMRISPLLFPLLFEENSEKSYSLIHDISSLTHAHLTSIDSCYIYLTYAKALYQSKNTFDAYRIMNELLSNKYSKNTTFERLFSNDFYTLDPKTFNSSGYVVGSLEIAIHTMLTTSNYEEAILKAISLGNDTDTSAAITGALAGLYYGYDNIPKHWLAPIKRKEDIQSLADQLNNKFFS